MSGLLQSLSNTFDVSPLLHSINMALENQPVLSFFNNHRISTACVSAVLLYGACSMVPCSMVPRNLPPGPWGYPIIGSSRSLPNNHDYGFGELVKKYGDVFLSVDGRKQEISHLHHLYDSWYWVVLGSYEAIKEAYITRGTDFVDRAGNNLNQLLDMNDSMFTSGYNEVYRNSRKVISQALRNAINTKLGDTLENEVTELDSVIQGSLGQPVDVSHDLQRVFTNTISLLLFNKKYCCGDKELDVFVDLIQRWFLAFIEGHAVVDIPIPIAKLYMPQTISKCRKITRELLDCITKYVDEHLESFNKEDIRDVIDAFILIKNQCGFTREQITSNLMVLLPDASSTVHEMMLWVLLYLVNHPDCQEQIHSEIQAVCGSRKVSVKDRASLPVTESFIMEVLRVVEPISMGVKNKPVQSTTFRGYNMPDYVGVTAFYGSVHRDPRFFPQPEKFLPERFVKDGKIGNTEGFMLFGIGRRMCMGEQLVKAELVYITATLVSQYRIRSPDGTPLNTEPSSRGLIKAPQEYSVIFDKR